MASTHPGQGTSERLTKSEFKHRAVELHADLLSAQKACLRQNRAVIILVSGVEAAGRSEVVNRLSGWLDMRKVRTFSYWYESDEERDRPFAWRFWRDLPGRGEIAILFGSWYTRTLMLPLADDCVDGSNRLTPAASKHIERQCQHINRLEELLAQDGVILIKLWFHIDAKLQRQRMREKMQRGHVINPYAKRNARLYDQFSAVSERVLEATATDVAGWHLVASQNQLSRDLQAGEIILRQLRLRPLVAPPEGSQYTPLASGQLLSLADLDRHLPKAKYKKVLKKLQLRLSDLHWRCWKKKRSIVMLFEGWDAAGKGGAIRRVTAKLDARLYRVIPVAAPTDEELAHHYLWRFWRRIPRDGYMTIYDRSWYGRVLVERVEDLATESQWQAAYNEINEFERQLTDHGAIVVKFWLQISPAEQLRRFEQREQLAHKRHKITAEDWRNRARRADYEQAVEDMLALTDKDKAPWHIVAAEDKQFARVQILETLCQAIDARLKR